MKILIIEDELAIAEVEKAYIEREGYEAEIAQDGLDGLAKFRADYLTELAGNSAAAAFAELCRERLKEGDVTLLFGAKDADRNQAVVLKEWLLSELGADR